MGSDSSEFSLFLKTEVTSGHPQHQHCSSKTIGSRVRQDCAGPLISLEHNWSEARDFWLI